MKSTVWCYQHPSLGHFKEPDVWSSENILCSKHNQPYQVTHGLSPCGAAQSPSHLSPPWRREGMWFLYICFAHTSQTPCHMCITWKCISSEGSSKVEEDEKAYARDQEPSWLNVLMSSTYAPCGLVRSQTCVIVYKVGVHGACVIRWCHSWARWHTPAIPATLEDHKFAASLDTQGHPAQHNKRKEDSVVEHPLGSILSTTTKKK